MTDRWRDRRVFVTGCSGLLGSWLAEALVHHGADVIGLLRDRVPRSRLYVEGTNERITLVDGDVRDRPLLERVINEYEVSVVFHLAAQTIVQIANRNPISTFETNISGTWNLLEACRRTSTVEAVVVASSDKAYGTQESLPYTEEAPLQGQHPYDVSKSCGDLIAGAFHTTFAVPVSVTRCGNLYGGGDLNFNRIVPGTMRSLYRGQRPIIRSDGSSVRDYFYVEDAVSAYLDLAETMVQGNAIGEAFNYSNEEPTTVLEIVDLIAEATGRGDVQPRVLGHAGNEIPEQHLSAAKAHAVLGWHPRYDLATGLGKTAEWYKRYLPNLPTEAGGV